ncbi:hypothetical protein [Citreimonas salinaria]|uniref:hypothetical protein n=1 Tax=Citreimonas salinaria TaxID=321339 RepID=UPI000B7E6421|nr:hypothetical protein [Citreimonas salinaria]
MPVVDLKHIAFIDLEASGLRPGSWPIEIGVAWLEGRKVIMHSSLICPRPGWSDDAWSEQSATVHRISRAELEEAPGADHVARWFLDLVGDRTLISDAPEHDGRWLERLLGERREIILLHDALWQAFSDDGEVAPGRLHHAYKNLRLNKPAHRAAEDAAAHAYAWRAALK